MRWPRRTISRIALGAFVLAAAGFLFAWSGVYNIAASRGHFVVTDRILTFGMRNSVKTHSLGIVAPPLDRPDLVILGAGHFHNGCAYCHGAPGVPQSPIALSMLPPAPDLSTQMREWRDRELFWIVKNGIKYAGMPHWVAQDRDDEVWAVVAFLKKLSTLDAASYRDLAFGPLPSVALSGRDIATGDVAAAGADACVRCHGGEGSLPPSKLVPVLHGQNAEYLTTAMRDYAVGTRHSGIMQPIAKDLSSGAATRVADFYAALKAPRADVLESDAIARGRRLAMEGDLSNKIPSCAACHTGDALKSYPRLEAQNALYAANRLRLWKNGLQEATEGAAIMAPIARGMSEQQIGDVTAYFASLERAAGGAR
jgi:cytochrome c553